MTTRADTSKRSLRRTLGLGRVSLAGIGVILGAGVYALIGPAAGHAGSALWLAFAFAGVAAGLTAYAYARLGAMRPKASAEFQYTALAFGPRVGFMAGWLMLGADVAAAAAVALGFGGYFAHLAGTPITLNALGLLAIVGLVIYAGIGQSVGLAVVLTVVEAAGLLFVVVVGAPGWQRTDYFVIPQGLGGVSTAAALIFFAYLGFDELGNLAEEMRDPRRDLPRALFIAMTTTTLIYLAVALSAVAVVDWPSLAASPAPLALVAGRVLGPGADIVMSLMALAATANTVLLLLVSASRSVYGMAAEDVLPRSMSRLSRTEIPAVAMLWVLGAAAALVMLGDLSQVAGLTDAAVLISFMCVNASLAWLGARRRTDGTRRRRIADVGLPALGLLLCGWLLIHSGWLSLAGAAMVAALGLVILRLSRPVAPGRPRAPGSHLRPSPPRARHSG